MIKETGRSTVLELIRAILSIFFNLFIFLLVAFGLVQIGKSSYSFAYEIFGEVVSERPPGNNVSISLSEKDTALDVAKKLREQKLVVNEYSFYVRTQLEMLDRKSIKPGEYVLNTSMTYEEILNEIVKEES